jgi:CBS domain-containing membrane protein
VSGAGEREIDPMKVRDLMQTRVFTIGRNDKVLEADALMERHRIRHLPVVGEEGELAGILSRRDAFRTALQRNFGYGEAAQDRLFGMLLVKEVMTNDVETATPDEAIEGAARRMLDKKISALVVVEGDRIVGMLTESDFVRHVAKAT